MAYYNPKRVDFAPNLGLIQSSGAVGNYLQNWSNNLTAQENHNQARQDKLDFQTWQKNRALVQDEQWNKAFEAGREDRVEDVNHRNNVFGLQQNAQTFNQEHSNRIFKAQQEANELALQKVAQEEARKQQINYITGMYNMQQDPTLKEMATSREEVFGAPRQTTGNKIIDQLLGGGSSFGGKMSAPNMQIKETINPEMVRLIGESKLKPPSSSSSEFVTLTKMLNDPTLTPQKRELVNDRITKLTQPDMNSEQISWNNLQKAQQGLAQKLGLPSQYSLATVDVTKLPPEVQAQASAIGQRTINILKSKNPAFEKSIGDLEAQHTQMNYALGALETVGDIRFVDETVRKYFSNYFGLSDKEMQSTEATLALQSASNMMIRIDSGATVTNNELERAIAASMTPYQHKDKILKGMKNMARRNMATLDGFKRSIDPVAFNLKYGAIRQNYETLYNTIDNMQGTQKSGGTWKEVGSTSIQAGVVETRVTQDGRTLQKLSDGTIVEVK